MTLRALTTADLEVGGIQRALRDGIERNYEGDLPPLPAGAECYSIYAAGELVGILAFRRDCPSPGAFVFDAVVVVPEHRGHAYAARALFAAEHRLAAALYFARVPRTNGRGLYFMLRCGYAPVVSPREDGTTWFRRGPQTGGRAAAARRRATRRAESG